MRWYSTNNSFTINSKVSQEMKAQLRVIANVAHPQKAQGEDDNYIVYQVQLNSLTLVKSNRYYLSFGNLKRIFN